MADLGDRTDNVSLTKDDGTLPVDVITDGSGKNRLAVDALITSNKVLLNAFGSFATSVDTTVSTAFARNWRLSWISADFSGVYDKEITVTINNLNGTNYDVPIYFLKQPGGTLSWFWQPTQDLYLMNGEEIDIKFQLKSAGVTCYWTVRGEAV
mgnify:CR=1 FL=1